MMEPARAGSVLVIGGGLAGLASAMALAPRGFQVTLLESRARLGGRASSFHDPASGLLIDTCQHVSMGCCTNLAHFCKVAGIDHLLQTQPELYFMTPDRRVSKLRADGLPAPFHLARSFLGAHYLSIGDKLRIAWGLACLRGTYITRPGVLSPLSPVLGGEGPGVRGRTPSDPAPSPQPLSPGVPGERGSEWPASTKNTDHDPPFLDWLQQHRQTARTIERFWGLVLTSALNESVDRVGLRYARKVFVDGFLRHRRGFEVALPTVPLGQLYGAELQDWFERHAVRLLLNHGVNRIDVNGGRVQSVTTRQGEVLQADWYITAVPFDRLLDLLPAEVIDRHEGLANLRRLETAPITSVHLWYDQPIMTLPHVVLVDCVGQWVFSRGESAPGEHYVQVVVSAARQFRGLGNEETQRRIVEELARLFPSAQGGLLRARVVTEHMATFSAVPGVDRWRTGQATPIDNLFLAGDWTATDWPATMEGAVRSGYLAAEALLQRLGRAETLLQPDL